MPLYAYTLLIALTALERLVEMAISMRNARWSFRQGGVEAGRKHFPFMVLLHTAFLVGCVAEPWLLDRPFIPELATPMLVIAVGCQALRWWVIGTLGRRWNTRVIVIPGLPRINTGPFHYLKHPNYLAVVLEGIALPMIHTAWLTALAFTACNAVLLTVRLDVEERALQDMFRRHTQPD